MDDMINTLDFSVGRRSFFLCLILIKQQTQMEVEVVRHKSNIRMYRNVKQGVITTMTKDKKTHPERMGNKETRNTAKVC